MTSKEIRESGLLELYALNEITDVNKKIVELAIEKDPALLADLQEIDRALFNFAQANALTPSNTLKNDILDNIRTNGEKSTVVKSIKNSEPQKKRLGLRSNWILFSLLAGSLFLVGYQFQRIQGYQGQLENKIAYCDSIANAQSQDIAQLKAFQDPSIGFYAFTPTDQFQLTDITLMSNTESSENYLKIDNLPDLEVNKTFQLWSLKENQDPIPLSVFQGKNGAIIPLDYEEGTVTYAITIENNEGASVPNLDQLIATVNV